MGRRKRMKAAEQSASDAVALAEQALDEARKAAKDAAKAARAGMSEAREAARDSAKDGADTARDKAKAARESAAAAKTSASKATANARKKVAAAVADEPEPESGGGLKTVLVAALVAGAAFAASTFKRKRDQELDESLWDDPTSV